MEHIYTIYNSNRKVVGVTKGTHVIETPSVTLIYRGKRVVMVVPKGQRVVRG